MGKIKRAGQWARYGKIEQNVAIHAHQLVLIELSEKGTIHLEATF